jgi:glucan biosynthesis protein C
MNPPTVSTNFVASLDSDNSRLDYLDATRAFALVLGIVFHACLSFVPIFMGWAVQDVSTSPLVVMFMTVSHSFRMETFFLLAGFFSHLTFHRKSLAEFLGSRVLRLVVPFVVGWFILRPLVVSGWIMGSASLRGHVEVWAGLRGGFQSLSSLPAGLFVGSHLWFLYYLAVITTIVLVLRALLAATGSRQSAVLHRADAFVAWLANCGGSLIFLAIPTAAALWFMRSWGMDTPDRSLLPYFPALAVYGGFFLLGWMLSRNRKLISRFARVTPQRCLIAAIGIAAILLLGDIERDPAHPRYVIAHVTYALGYALTMWSLMFLTIGVFQKLCSRPNAFVRYVADSSYWMYLLHLPVVIWLQVAIAELPLHWSFKLAFIATLTIALSLLSYDLFVRSTFMGSVLNGRRRDRVIAPLILSGLRHVWGGKQLEPLAKLKPAG